MEHWWKIFGLKEKTEITNEEKFNNAVPCCGGETSKGQATMAFTNNGLMCEHAWGGLSE